MAIDWSKVFAKYKGLWVAFAEDERTVVGSGKSAKSALQAATRRGVERPVLMKMPMKLVSYVGSFRV